MVVLYCGLEYVAMYMVDIYNAADAQTKVGIYNGGHAVIYHVYRL